MPTHETAFEERRIDSSGKSRREAGVNGQWEEQVKRILVVGTADTKGEELAWLAGAVSAAGVPVLTADVGTRKPTIRTDIDAAAIAACHPAGADAVLGGDDRGEAVSAMGKAFSVFVRGRDDISGVIGIGGSGGTSIVTAGMRELPYGLPKVMVSTLASSDVSAVPVYSASSSGTRVWMPFSRRITLSAASPVCVMSRICASSSSTDASSAATLAVLSFRSN